MKNLKPLLVVLAALGAGTASNILIGGGYYQSQTMSPSMINAQRIITQYVTQYRYPFIDPSDYFEISKDFVKGLVNALVPNTFGLSDLIDPSRKNQIMTIVWNIPYFGNTVNNYAVLQNNQTIYRERLWQSLGSQITEIAHQIDELKQYRKPESAQPAQQRPLPSIPQASRPLPTAPQVTSRPLPGTPDPSADLEQAKQNFYRMIEFKSTMITGNPFSMFTFQNGLLVVNQDLLKELYATLTINGKIALNNTTKPFIIKNMKDGITNLMQEGFEDYFKTLRMAEREQKRKAIENYIETQITQFVDKQGTMIRSRI